MSGLRRKKSRRRASITSLIDVIFLLLLFFMLSSTFSQFSSVELVSKTATQGGSPLEGETITITVEAVSVRINGVPVADERLVERISSDGNGSVLVMPAADVTTQRLVDVLALLRRADGVSIHVMEAS